jgi:hypothetical protein
MEDARTAIAADDFSKPRAHLAIELVPIQTDNRVTKFLGLVGRLDPNSDPYEPAIHDSFGGREVRSGGRIVTGG